MIFVCVTVWLLYISLAAASLVRVHSIGHDGVQGTLRRRPLPDIQGGKGQPGRQSEPSNDWMSYPHIAALL